MQTAAQSPATESGICKQCGGKKYILKGPERRGAVKVKVKCYHCRGTGQASPGYSTK